MKFNIFIITILLLINGCGGTESEETVDGTPVEVVPPVEKKVSNWYMKTIVDTTLSDGTSYSYQKGGVFGELEESSDRKDRYDVLSYGTRVLHIVFPQIEWAENNGDYVSDYHGTKDEGEKRVWTFQVKNQSNDIDLSNAPLKITLDGPYDVEFKNENGYMSFKEKLSGDSSKRTSIILVDVDNQTEYNYADLKTANLSMDGLKTRTFRWVLGSVDPSDYETLSSLETNTAKVSVSSKSIKSSATSNPNDKFGLPPSF